MDVEARRIAEEEDTSFSSGLVEGPAFQVRGTENYRFITVVGKGYAQDGAISPTSWNPLTDALL